MHSDHPFPPQQDESQQASLSWHSDAEDLKQSPRTNLITSVIVQLTKDEVSGMRMGMRKRGVPPHIYTGHRVVRSHSKVRHYMTHCLA